VLGLQQQHKVIQRLQLQILVSITVRLHTITIEPLVLQELIVQDTGQLVLDEVKHST
jgi:predicted nucleotidyltransferase